MADPARQRLTIVFALPVAAAAAVAERTIAEEFTRSQARVAPGKLCFVARKKSFRGGEGGKKSQNARVNASPAQVFGVRAFAIRACGLGLGLGLRGAGGAGGGQRQRERRGGERIKSVKGRTKLPRWRAGNESMNCRKDRPETDGIADYGRL